MMLGSIKIKLDTEGHGEIEIDGINLSPYVSQMVVRMAAGHLTDLIIAIVPHIIEIDAPAEVKVLIDKFTERGDNE